MLLTCEDGHKAIAYEVGTFAQKCPICVMHDEIAESEQIHEDLIKRYEELHMDHENALDKIQSMEEEMDELYGRLEVTE